MRIKTVDAELYFLIKGIWQQEAFMREDDSRSLEAMERNLIDDPGTYWYFGPSKDTFLYLSDLNPGHWARVHFINVGNWEAYEDRRVTLKILKTMADEFNLHLIWASVPAPVNRLKSLLRHLGFSYEGRLRKRIFYDGGWVDAETYSILAEEIDGKAKKRHRKRRSRRDVGRVHVEDGSRSPSPKAGKPAKEVDKETK